VQAALALDKRLPPVDLFVEYRPSVDGSYLRTEGAGLLGLPDVATAVVPRSGDGLALAKERLRALVTQWASPSLTGSAPIPPHTVSALPSSDRWLVTSTDADAQHVMYQFGFAQYAAAAFAGRQVAVDAWLVGPPRYHVMRLACDSELVAYVSNGLGSISQRGGHAEDGNDFVELCALVRHEVPGLANVIARLGAAIHAPTSTHPMGPWDRSAIQLPNGIDIAGVVWKPLVDFDVIDNRWHVNVWDALPITHAELAEFRADPGAQGRWINERYERVDYAALHDRWLALANVRP
jgi:hypothetical protein